jgi:hypothetical protein
MRLLIVAVMLCANTLASFAQARNYPLIGSGSHGIVAQRKALACGAALRQCLASCRKESPRFRPVCDNNCVNDFDTCNTSFCPLC